MNEKRESENLKNGIHKDDRLEMNKQKGENLIIAQHEVGEDNTKYGEFISTYFAWIPLNKQKEKANEMDKMTKKEH